MDIPIFLPLGLLVVLLSLALAFVRFRQVRQDRRWVIERFGKYAYTMTPGLNIMFAFIEKVRAKVSTREFLMSFLVDNTTTNDGVTIPQIEANLRTMLKPDDPYGPYQAVYALGLSMTQIEDEKREYRLKYPDDQALSNYDGPYERAAKNKAASVLRSIVGEHDFNFIRTCQPELREIIRARLADDLDRWGHIVLELDIPEIKIPDAIAQALAAPFEAERQGAAAIATALAQGKAAEAEAQGQASAVRTTADADRYAAVAAADAKAQADVLEAQSKTKVLAALIAELVGSGIPAEDAPQIAIDYMLADNRIDAMASVATGEGTLILGTGQNAAADLAATFSGVSDFAKKVRAGKKTPTTE